MRGPTRGREGRAETAGGLSFIAGCAVSKKRRFKWPNLSMTFRRVYAELPSRRIGVSLVRAVIGGSLN